MDTPDLSALQLLWFGLLGLVIMVVYPFVKAALLHGSARLLKFRRTSYWKSFFCVLIGIGTSIAVTSLIVMPRITQGVDSMNEVSILSTGLNLILVPAAETTAMYFFFRESVLKSIGAVIAAHGFLILLVILLVVLIAFTASLVA